MADLVSVCMHLGLWYVEYEVGGKSNNLHKEVWRIFLLKFCRRFEIHVVNKGQSSQNTQLLVNIDFDITIILCKLELVLLLPNCQNYDRSKVQTQA